jgi:hypothetical protein
MNEENARYVWRHGKRIEVVTLDTGTLVPPHQKRAHTAGDAEDRLIGCPVWWVKRVRPVLKTKDQLIVAVYLWRRWVVSGKRETFDVPNGELRALGISRKVKYGTLDLLAAAGLIRVARRSAKAALAITILATKPRRK